MKNDGPVLKARGPVILSATLRLALVIVLGFGCIFMLARWMEDHPRALASELQDDDLYVSGPTAKRFSLGFNGLVADWYWMRSLQYVGRKMLNYKGRLQLDDLRSLNLRLLAPMLTRAATLDPQFMAVYEYGAMVLPATSEQDAITLTRLGIAANPSSWRLYQHLGYIYWQLGNYADARDVYDAGARLAGAPKWMAAMSARMAAEGGSRNTAREMYRRMYDESDDDQVKQMARQRLAQLDSYDERDVIRRILSDFAVQTKRCAGSWNEVARALAAARLRISASGVPLDPANTPYRLVKDGCDVDVDPVSQIPYR